MLDKNLDRIFEFEKYVLEHPDFVKRIPLDAIVSIRVDGDEIFNRWSQRLAERQLTGRRRDPFF
jgi:hypothetical protein